MQPFAALFIFFLFQFGLSSSSSAQCSFTITADVTDIDCFNGTTGGITVNVSGGSGPFSYQLAEAGAGAWQSTNEFIALTANTYPVSVRDGSGCIKTIYVTVRQPAPLQTAYTAAHVSCTGADNGMINTNTTGGTAPYTFNWTRNGTAYAATPDIQNLSPGNYLLTVTDAKGCTTSPVIESEMQPVVLTGFNVDVIANGTGAASSSTTGAVDNGPNGTAFYAAGYNNGTTTGASGLPASGIFNSAQNSGREYRLASYTASNALVLRSASNPDLSKGGTSGTLAFATPHKSLYSTLYVVGTTGNGTGVTNYTVHFTDGGGTYSGSLNFPDWYLTPGTPSAARALGGLDRVSTGSGSTFTGSTNFNLFEAPVTIPVESQGREIDHIDFAWSNADQARINLFAITGYTSTAYGIRINDGPASDVSPAASIQHDAPGNQFCSGQSVTFTAVPQQAGSSPSYQWYVNSVLQGGAVNADFTTSSLNDDDVVSVTITAGGAGTGCLSATTANASVTMTLASRTAGVSIATVSTTVCAGLPVTFDATPLHGGSSPLYQWQVNGANAGVPTASPSFTSSALNSGDDINVIMTSSIGCATNNPASSNIISLTVLPIGEPAVQITAVPAVSFSSVSDFGGTAPVYQWYLNGVPVSGAESPTYSTTSAIPGEQYSLKMTSDYACRTAPAAMSNYIQITPIILPVRFSGFTAEQEGATALLKWETVYESNVRRFLVQRSANMDGVFRTIGMTDASGLAAGSNYTFRDNTVLQGFVQYRIATEDLDGKLEFSAVRSLRVTSAGLQVSDRGHSWYVPNVQPLQYVLTDLQGKVLQAGATATSLLLAKPAAKGIYLLKISTSGTSATFKVPVF